MDRPSPATDAALRLAAAMDAAEDQVSGLHAQLAEIIAASADSNADDEHDPEGATIAFERQQLVALIAQAEATRAELGRALERLAQGSYGRCQACGELISAGRLAARPSADRCIRCARRLAL